MTMANTEAIGAPAERLRSLTDTDVTFLLTTGGHNAGIVSQPGANNRSYRVKSKPHDGQYTDPDSWVTDTESTAGSWWPEWFAWLEDRSSPRVAPPPMGSPNRAPLGPAPGAYVQLP